MSIPHWLYPVRPLSSQNRRRLGAVVAGGLLALCFPPYGLWFLVPLPFLVLYPVMESVGPWSAARLGALFAGVFYLLHTYWFASFHPIALPGMLLWLGLVHAVGFGLVSMIGWGPWSGTLGWVSIQWFLGVGYHAFPWSRLATAMAAAPSFLQPVRYLGELTWGGVWVLGAFLIADSITSRRLRWSVIPVVILIGLAVGEGSIRYHFEQVHRTGQRVTLVQPNAQPGEVQGDRYLQFRRLSRMTRDAARQGDLVVWPETAVMRMPLVIAGEQLRWQTVRWQNFFRDLVEPGFSLFFGLRFNDPKPGHLDLLNGAALLGTDGAPAGFYTKRRPVPGGEHLPYMGSSPLVRSLGRAVGTLGYRHGTKGGLVPFRGSGGEWLAGVQICFEDAFSQHVRDQVNRGADLLINISNDSWSRSSASHWQHFYRARIRAVETGRTVVRNGNTGVSALIDPLGRIPDMLRPYEQGVVHAQLVRPLDRTPYVRWGNWITTGCITFLIVTAFISRARRAPPDTTS